jgi:hypothetical protein
MRALTALARGGGGGAGGFDACSAMHAAPTHAVDDLDDATDVRDHLRATLSQRRRPRCVQSTAPRLRVAYVSYDARDNHPVGRILAPVVASHRRRGCGGRASAVIVNYGASQTLESYSARVSAALASLEASHAAAGDSYGEPPLELQCLRRAALRRPGDGGERRWMDLATLQRCLRNSESPLRSSGSAHTDAVIASAASYFNVFNANGGDADVALLVATVADVVVDVTGPTQGWKPKLFEWIVALTHACHRPAVVLGYLAFPGSFGAVPCLVFSSLSLC